MMMTMMIMPVSKTTSKENLKPNCYCGQLDPFCMGKNIWLTTTNLTFVWMTICCWPFSLCFGFGLTHLVWFNTKSRSRGFAWHQSSEIEINVKQIYLTSSNTRWVGPLILMHDTICFSLDYCVTVLQKWYRRFISEAWHVHVLLAWSFWQNSSLGCLTRA